METLNENPTLITLALLFGGRSKRMKCGDCKFRSHGCFDEPCRSCDGFNKYILKWQKTMQAKIVMFGIVAILIWLALLLAGRKP